MSTTIAQWLSRGTALPCDQVLLDGVGHMPFFEAPDEFARAVGAFLGRNTSP